MTKKQIVHTLGQVVKNKRKEQKLTQKELAQKMQTSQSVIGRLEGSQLNDLTLSFLIRLSQALNVLPADLLEEALSSSGEFVSQESTEVLKLTVAQLNQKLSNWLEKKND
jgi:transcriptional regulator with XRE-family HTH domain